MSASLYTYSICSVEDIKENLGIPSSNHNSDNLVTRMANRATDLVENYTGRRFKLTEYTNVEYDASGIDQLILKQRPITTFVSLDIRHSVLNEDSWETIDPELYFVDSSAAVIDLDFQAGGRWNRYRVSYTAGYDIIPADLAEAAAALATHFVKYPDGNVNVHEKQEGGRRIRYLQGLTGTRNLFQQLGIDETIDSYSNQPILADK